jgi:anti-sigma factor RsiW
MLVVGRWPVCADSSWRLKNGKQSGAHIFMTTSPMTCRDFVSSLGNYLDGSVTAGHRARMDAHEAGCIQCAAYRKSYEATVRLTKAVRSDDVDETEIPEKLVRSILARRRN